MPVPTTGRRSRRKPISYDPSRDKYIYEDEVASGAEKIVPWECLSDDDIGRLVIKREQAEPRGAPRQGPMSGPMLTRDEMIRAIEQGEGFGRVKVQAEIAYLKEYTKDMPYADGCKK